MNYDQNDIRLTSQCIAYLLRHNPTAASLDMDEQGWVPVDQLIANIPMVGHVLDEEKLAYIVENDDKTRYVFNTDGSLIRACQGHSVDVDVGLIEETPPAILWHGTACKFTDSINAEGLLSMLRLYVHLSSDIETARVVGSRHGKPAVYEVASGEMFKNGFTFYRSENGVWLCDYVPSTYLKRVE